MKPLETLASELTPDGEELVLYRRDGIYNLRVSGLELMSSRAHGSEEVLARLACGDLDGRVTPRVLIGGLGFGYTLRAALDLLPHNATVTLCEVFESLLRWNRDLLGELAGHPLDDPRVEAMCSDVRRLLDGSARFDVIILDVDNGPWAFTLRSNRFLYTRKGVAQLFDCLNKNGTLAVWSSEPDPAFERLLERAGFEARSERVPARGRLGGPPHTVFVALKK